MGFEVEQVWNEDDRCGSGKSRGEENARGNFEAGFHGHPLLTAFGYGSLAQGGKTSLIGFEAPGDVSFARLDT